MGQGGFADRPSFPATCSNCGQETTVPFKPTDGRPVYCRDCFKQMKGNRPAGGRGPRA